MIIYDNLRTELLGLFSKVLELARQGRAEESTQRLTAARQRLRDGRLTTVVCGEFKRGKSSLLAALLDEPELFPVDVDIATNMISVVGYGDPERITVALADGSDERTQSISRRDIPKYVTERENRHNTRNVALLAIQTPNPKLASGWILVDTPGVGGLNRDHTAVTYGFLPSADTVIFVGDATAPLTESELDFVRRISEYCTAIVFVVTKIDLRDDYELIVANTRRKLAEVTGQPAEELVVIGVSSSAKLAYLCSKDDEDLELSNFATLERTLHELLERRRGQILLTRAVNDLDRVAAALALPIETALHTARESTQAQLADITTQLEANRRRTAELTGGQALWRQNLRKYLGTQAKESRIELHAGLTRIWQRMPTYLEDDRMRADPGLVVDALGGEVGLLLGALTEQACARAATVAARLERETGLTLVRNQLPGAVLPPIEYEVPERVPQVQTAQDRRNKKLRDTMFVGGLGSTVGSVVGAVIGGLLGGPAAAATAPVGASIGAAIVGIVAGAVSYRNAARSITLSDRAARITALRNELMPLQNLHRIKAEKALDEVYEQLIEAIETDLTAKIRLEHESLTAALRSLTQARSQTMELSGAQIRELTDSAQLLARIRQRCAVVLAEIAGVPGQLAVAPVEPDGDSAPAESDEFDDPGALLAGTD